MLAESRGALVALQARDFERAINFYTAVLGLEMTFRHEDFWAEFRAPGLSLGISVAGDGVVVGGGTTTICFEVRDIASTVDQLRARGVSFQGSVIELFHGREAYFTDSEGNPLMLHQSSMAQVSDAKRAKPSQPAKRTAGKAPGKFKKSAKPAGTTARAKTATRPRSAARPAAKGKKGKGRRR